MYVCPQGEKSLESMLLYYYLWLGPLQKCNCLTNCANPENNKSANLDRHATFRGDIALLVHSLSLSVTQGSSILFQQQANATFCRVCRIISGHYLSRESTWVPQQSIGDRWKQFSDIFGEGLGERKGGSWQLSGTISNTFWWETLHPNITPAKWWWT